MANWYRRRGGQALGIGVMGLISIASMAVAFDRSAQAFPAIHSKTHPSFIARKPDETPPSEPIRPKTACPNSLQSLMPLLLRDLPAYSNRVSQRAYTNYRTAEVPGYVLLAGRPEYEPLPLPPNSTSNSTAATTNADVEQVFFTTLERQYLSGEAFQLQHYHWLFLTQTESGWRFVLMLSSVGNATADEPPTPPQDSSQGIIAQAIRLWLRDCEANSIAP